MQKRPSLAIVHRTHKHYCGIDLHTNKMYLCILKRERHCSIAISNRAEYFSANHSSLPGRSGHRCRVHTGSTRLPHFCILSYKTRSNTLYIVCWDKRTQHCRLLSSCNTSLIVGIKFWRADPNRMCRLPMSQNRLFCPKCKDGRVTEKRIWAGLRPGGLLQHETKQ